MPFNPDLHDQVPSGFSLIGKDDQPKSPKRLHTTDTKFLAEDFTFGFQGLDFESAEGSLYTRYGDKPLFTPEPIADQEVTFTLKYKTKYEGDVAEGKNTPLIAPEKKEMLRAVAALLKEHFSQKEYAINPQDDGSIIITYKGTSPNALQELGNIKDTLQKIRDKLSATAEKTETPTAPAEAEPTKSWTAATPTATERREQDRNDFGAGVTN